MLKLLINIVKIALYFLKSLLFRTFVVTKTHLQGSFAHPVAHRVEKRPVDKWFLTHCHTIETTTITLSFKILKHTALGFKYLDLNLKTTVMTQFPAS